MLAHCAAMLSGEERYLPEAKSHLRAAPDWLGEWGGLPDDERREQPLTGSDIAAMGLASLRFDGMQRGTRFITGWLPATVPFRVGGLVTRRLLDVGRADEAGALAAAVLGRAGPALAVASEFARVAVAPPARACRRAVGAVLRAPPPGEDWEHQQTRLRLTEGVLALAEAAARYGISRPRTS